MVELGRREETLAGRGLLAELYAAYFPGEMPRILLSPEGKPYFDRSDAPYFSISHNGELVVCVLDSRGPVGVDVCQVRESSYLKYDALFRRMYGKEEQAYVMAADTDAEAARRFYEIWTRKEAAVKKTGVGISGLSSVNKILEEAAEVSTFSLREAGGLYAVSIVS